MGYVSFDPWLQVSGGTFAETSPEEMKQVLNEAEIAMLINFVPSQPAGRSIAPRRRAEGGKSGQLRAPSFLTGRYPKGYSSVTENNSPAMRGIGEKVR